MTEGERKQSVKTSQILPVQAEHISATLLVGHLFYTQGKIEEAKKIFEGLFVLDQTNPYVHAILGSIHQKQRLYPAAVMHYSHAIRLFPGDIESLTNRGEIFMQHGRFKEAASDFKNAIELDPQQQSPAANRARLLSALAKESLELTKTKGFGVDLHREIHSGS